HQLNARGSFRPVLHHHPRALAQSNLVLRPALNRSPICGHRHGVIVEAAKVFGEAITCGRSLLLSLMLAKVPRGFKTIVARSSSPVNLNYNLPVKLAFHKSTFRPVSSDCPLV